MNTYDLALTCSCGKQFWQHNALSNHRNKCAYTKRELSDLLSKAKEVWEEKQLRKRRKLTTQEPEQIYSTSNSQSTPHQLEAQAQLDLNSSSQGKLPALSDTDLGANAHIPSSPVLQPLPAELTSDILVTRRCSTRERKPSSRLVDMVPHAAIDWGDDDEGIPSTPGASSSTLPSLSFPSTTPVFCTSRDQFGLVRQYYCAFPPHDPDRNLSLQDISDIPTTSARYNAGCTTTPTSTTVIPTASPSLFDPYPNKSAFLLAEWYWGGAKKSRRDFKALIDIFKDEEFRLDDIRTISWEALDQRLIATATSDGHSVGREGHDGGDPSFLSREMGWIKEEISLVVPFHRRQSSAGPKEYFAGSFFRKNICSVIRQKLEGPAMEGFHFEPYDLFFQPHPSHQPQRVFGEMYTSTAFIKAHLDVQTLPIEETCTLPRYIASLMFSSDETHLTQFGETKLWPLYLQFGNETKYNRCKPSLELCHHVGYFITLDDSFEDFIRSQIGGQNPSEKLISHCAREILHTQWGLILDDEFLEAYCHGMVVDCFDGIRRRIFLRIFALIADYKEKVLLAGIKQLGKHPCPRCLTPLDVVHDLGSKEDSTKRSDGIRRDDKEYRKALQMARKRIYKENYSISGVKVMKGLDEMSIMPAENAFSSRLSRHGFNVFKALLVDLMHEIETGTWKCVFKHILRILFCENKGLVFELDSRFRRVPTFGTDTIRKFRRNISSMRNLAARDWEDILQCSIPVIEGLLPSPHNEHLLELLFLFGHWHGLAKLRMHTEATLDLLENATSDLGNSLRHFQATTCAAYRTRELPKDMYERTRRKNKASGKAKSSTSLQHEVVMTPALVQSSKTAEIPTPLLNKAAATVVPQTTSAVEAPASKLPSAMKADTPERVKKFNLNTYKFHAMGDYVATIREFGTTDSFSTEVGELEHRRSKARYSRTNKKGFVKQIARVEHRQSRLKRIRQQLLAQLGEKGRYQFRTDFEEAQSPTQRFHVSKTNTSSDQIPRFLQIRVSDPATKNFLNKLKLHVLPRVQKTYKLPNNISIFFEHDRIYHHKVIRFNYTTYDLRRAQDSINPRTSHCNIMMLSDSTGTGTGHPYLYARVIGIFHVNVVCTGIGLVLPAKRLDVLWVRWFDHLPPRTSRSLDRLSFPPVGSSDAFGFVDPDDVLRAVHVIPAFHFGQRHDEDGAISDSETKEQAEWKQYYVNRFADRDMLMRYHPGLGVGHSHFSSPPAFRETRAPFNYTNVDPHGIAGGSEEIAEPTGVQPSYLGASSVEGPTEGLRTNYGCDAQDDASVADEDFEDREGDWSSSEASAGSEEGSDDDYSSQASVELCEEESLYWSGGE